MKKIFFVAGTVLAAWLFAPFKMTLKSGQRSIEVNNGNGSKQIQDLIKNVSDRIKS